LDVNPKRLGLSFARIFGGLNGFSEVIERRQRLVHGRGHSRWEVTGDSVPSKESINGILTIGIVAHQVVSGGAMRVHVNKPRRQSAITKVPQSAAGRSFGSNLRRYFKD